MKRYDLFSIPLGTLPGELDWFYRDGFRMAGTADIHVRDGLIYISGGHAGKVMVFNSYGDLLTFTYDPARNPAPAVLNEDSGGISLSPWPFRNPTAITAYDGGFLVEDGLDAGRRMDEGGNGILYDRVVLRFDKDGSYLGHLGREGFGGSPFPYIDTLDVRQDGGIVVTGRVPGAWMSYWFDSEGHHVATVRIREDQLPGLGEGLKLAVYSVRPDPGDWKLHIRVDVYPAEGGGISPEPRLYELDLNTLEYGEPIILPYGIGNEEDGIPAVPPEYLGTTLSGDHMVINSEGPGRYRMSLIDEEGRVIENRRLQVDADASVYRRFRMQGNGLLAGLFMGLENATVSWWRVDRLLKLDD